METTEIETGFTRTTSNKNTVQYGPDIQHNYFNPGDTVKRIHLDPRYKQKGSYNGMKVDDTDTILVCDHNTRVLALSKFGTGHDCFSFEIVKRAKDHE